MLPDNHEYALDTVMLQVSQAKWRTRWAYYIGDHPKIWATPKIEETFRALADSMTENYCGLAVDSRLARMEITGWDGVEKAQQVWESTGMPQKQDVFFRWGLVYGTVYVIVQDDQIVVNKPTIAYAQADPNDWMRNSWAGKAWFDFDAGYWYACLWDETHLYRYKNPNRVAYSPNTQVIDRLPTGQDFVLEGEEPHGYGVVPVFQVHPFGDEAAPLIDKIKPIQDKINKLSANKFVAAEFGAFKQRVFFTRQQLDPYDVRQQPDHAIVLDPGDSDGRAAVQELGGTDLHQYDDAKDAEINSLFTIATLPRHLRVNPGAHVSGEALKADEGPFVESVKDHQREFGEALVSAMRLVGVDADPIWRAPEANDDLKQAQVVDTFVRAGLPWETAAVKFGGMTPEEVDAAKHEAAEAGAAQQALVGQQAGALLSNPLLAYPQA